MKTTTISSIFTAILMVIASIATAQIQPDTISIGKRKPFFEYKQQDVSRPALLREILLKEPVDRQVKTQWGQYQTFHGIGIGIEIGGLGLMGYSLAQSLSGNESGTTMIAGAGLMLTGVIIDSFVARARAKAAVKSYNDIQMNRVLPEAALWPSEKSPQPDTTQQAVPAPVPQKQVSHPANTTGNYIGITAGKGWSRQKINYAFALGEKILSADISSFGIQYGESFSENMGWQIELGLTQHGLRVEETSNSGGVKIYSKADARVRYLEIPVCLTHKTSLGKSKIEVMATPGINFGYAVSGRIVAQGSGENETRMVWTKIVDQISLAETTFGDRLDIALLLGAQAAYPIGPGKVFLEARYHLGMLNLERNTVFSFTEGGDKAFNRTMVWRLGYRYGL